ncbi:MAG TPA: nucleoside hydrolase [Bryobacteraceae bacterium]|nr:nucleoside hydrolase [Bryobacteraceae bacterium]
MALWLALSLAGWAAAEPVRIIFDTDMGNDVDDALALAELHAFESRGEARLLAVTITKDNRWAPVFVDLLNTYYGRPDIPIGMVKHGKTPDGGNYTRAVATMQGADGAPLYRHAITEQSDLPDAVLLLRKTLAAQADASVVIVQVGFSTNLARLLDSQPDDFSPLSGRELAARKVRLVSIMGGEFRAGRHTEYNIVMDIPAAQKLFREWPGEIVTSAFDIGESIQYPAGNIAADFRYRAHHPLADAYRAYRHMPYDEPLWDPTAALYAVRPDRGYFSTSPTGQIMVDSQGVTTFTPGASGKQRYLIVDDAQRARIREAISMLVSEP